MKAKVDQDLPTYKYRFEYMLKAFVTIKEAGSEFVASSTYEYYVKNSFMSSSSFHRDSRNDDAEFWENDDGQHSRPGVDFCSCKTLSYKVKR